MKCRLTLILLIQLVFASAQSTQSENIFIITLDGVRWQEIFKGADDALINNNRFTKDTSLSKQMFWDKSVEERRKKLMPFFWNVIAQRGQLYGNRKYRNNVNVTNKHRFSYPGYNEILTGFPEAVHSNKPVENQNTNILEFLNQQPAYKDQVVAFTSWSIFPQILGTHRNDLPVYSGYTPLPDSISNTGMRLLNEIQEQVIEDTTTTRYDQLTFVAAREYVKQHHPKVVYISFGDPDECAHQGEYDEYLQALNNIDRMISQLWYFIQSSPEYKDKTSLLITTDHGRGKKVKHWKSHNFLLRGSADIWLALMGPDIKPEGEIKEKQQIYQEQIANTIAGLLGKNFVTDHPVAEPIELSIGK